MAMESLHAACAAESTATVDDVASLVARGHDVNGTDADGRTPLHIAARNDKLEIAAFLLSKGVAVDAKMPRGFTPLHYAARHARLALVQCLVEHGADVNASMEHGLSVAHVAAERGRLDVVQYLVENGANVNAYVSRRVSVIQAAAREGHLAVVQYLVERGIDVNTANKDGVTILHEAASRDHAELVSYLLDQGVSVNVVDKQGRTPLHRALWGTKKKCNGVYPVVLALVSHGATWDPSCVRELQFGIKRHPSFSDGANNASESKKVRWQAGYQACINHWAQQAAAGTRLMDIPVEVVMRGEDSVKTYLAAVRKSGLEQLILRRKVCVVGPSQWGKTSLIKSLTTLKSMLVAVADRTIGIDLFAYAYDEAETDGGVSKRHEITFWDFAGQDEYQVAHAMFFSKRTLYLVCIDMEKYEQALQASEAIGNTREAEHYMTRFLRTNVFRWVRAIISRQADAEFVVVGTKMDKMKSQKQVDALWRDLYTRLNEWTRTFVEEINQELLASTNADTTEDNSDIEALRASIMHLFAKDWITVSSADPASIQAAVSQLERKISGSNRSFAMPTSYTRVLEAIQRRREQAAWMGSVNRVANIIIPMRALYKDLAREVEDMTFDECCTILETLHDLGDILWYQHEASGVLKDVVILDPTLVLDFVREVITHEHYARSDKMPATHLDEGRLAHAFLRELPLWQDLDEELVFAFKQLLQYFQLVYPADNTEMDWDSDLIVPTYWKVNHSEGVHPRLAKHKSLIQRHGVNSASHFCWEYELSSEVSDTVFEQFAVQSYSALLKRSVRPKYIEAFVHGDCAALITLTPSVASRDVIRIEVAVADPVIGWNYLRYYAMAIETVLDSYPGLVVSRYIVDPKDGATRHRLSAAVQILEDALWMGKDDAAVRETMPWLPADMNWFIERVWRNPGALQQMRTQDLVREAVNKLDVLKTLVVTDNHRRRYPALWTLDYDSENHKITVKMLSDLSGDCFHDPIEIAVPSSFLANHGKLIQNGISILSNVVPEIVSLGLVQKVIKVVAPALDSRVSRAQKVYNMIDKLDLSTHGVTDLLGQGDKISPRGATALLRDLLKLHDDSFDELRISDLSKLQCAATEDGHFIWANRQEIMALGDKLIPCDPDDVKLLKRTLSSSSTATSTSSISTEDTAQLRLRLSIPSVLGLSAWDWRRAYCKWQVTHPSRAVALAAGSTPPHSDSSAPPSWPAVEFAVSSIASVGLLRECILTVRVKRPSRCLGIVKVIGEGAIRLGDTGGLRDSATDIPDLLVFEVPFGSDTAHARIVTVRLTPW